MIFICQNFKIYIFIHRPHLIIKIIVKIFISSKFVAKTSIVTNFIAVTKKLLQWFTKKNYIWNKAVKLLHVSPAVCIKMLEGQWHYIETEWNFNLNMPGLLYINMVKTTSSKLFVLYWSCMSNSLSLRNSPKFLTVWIFLSWINRTLITIQFHFATFYAVQLNQNISTL